MKASHRLHIDAANAVEVFVTTAVDPNQVLDSLVALGFKLQRSDDAAHILQGSVPIASLQAASQLPDVTGIREPDYPRSPKFVTTEGDITLHADELRANLGTNGAGVRVRVISDGLYGLATAQSTGTRRPRWIPRRATSTVEIRRLLPPAQRERP